MKDRLLPFVLDWFKECVVPNHKTMVFGCTVQPKTAEESNHSEMKDHDEIQRLLLDLVKEVSRRPEEVFWLQ